jgi:CheY-like chemotaxis protein
MTFERVAFNLEDSLLSMVKLFENTIKEKNLVLETRFDSGIPKAIIGDSLRLRQVILNLVSNAVKFTEQGRITLTTRILNEDTEIIQVEFTLEDTGIGIPKNRQEQIFTIFEQAGLDTSRNYGGTGLGLAIVKQLIELQGGSIAMKSISGKGSEFKFKLNFEKFHNDYKPSKNSHEELLKLNINSGLLENMRVLVAEDVPLNQLLLKIILTDFGCNITMAGTGKIALEYMKENTYDIILMDLQMPDMNGFEATEYIRDEMNSQIPIIALTADVTTIDFEKCLIAGMNDYLSKPIDENILYSKLVKNLKIKTEA